MKTIIYAELGKDTDLDEFMEAAEQITKDIEGEILWDIAEYKIDKLQLHVVKDGPDPEGDIAELSRQTMRQHEILKIALIDKGIITEDEYKEYWKKAIKNLEVKE